MQNRVKQQPKQQLNRQPMLWILLREHADHILGTYLQYADHKARATLPIGVNNVRKRKRKG